MNQPQILKQRQLSRRAMLLISILLMLIDQISKSWARQQLNSGFVLPFVPGLVQLRLISNTGAAFNLFNGATFLLGLLSLAVTIGLMVWIWRAGQMPIWQGLAVSFLLGGTIGNGLDRWRLGHVTDFLQLVPVDFPIFNGADVAINLAVICFGIDALTRRHGQQHT